MFLIIFYSLKSEQVIYKSSIFATSIDHIVFKPFSPKIKNPIDSIFSEKMILQIIEFSYMNF